MVLGVSYYLGQHCFDRQLYMTIVMQLKARQVNKSLLSIVSHFLKFRHSGRRSSVLNAVSPVFVHTHELKCSHPLSSPQLVNIETACRFSCLLINPIISSKKKKRKKKKSGKKEALVSQSAVCDFCIFC